MESEDIKLSTTEGIPGYRGNLKHLGIISSQCITLPQNFERALDFMERHLKYETSQKFQGANAVVGIRSTSTTFVGEDEYDGRKCDKIILAMIGTAVFADSINEY